MKKAEAHLPGVVYHKLLGGQLFEPVPHKPVHRGHSPWVVVVGQISLASEFLLATFGQPLSKFLGVVFAAWHDLARYQKFQFVLQQVEDCKF